MVGDRISYSIVLCSLKRPRARELAIPLMVKNRWVETKGDSESVDGQAVEELIEGENTGDIVQLFNSNDLLVSKVPVQYNYHEIERNQKPSKILLAESRRQNKVLDGFEDGDQIRVDLRPESVSARVTCVFDFE